MSGSSVSIPERAQRALEERGYSLMELLVAMGMFSILVSLAIPHYIEFNKSYNREHARTLFLHDLKRAQAETITQGCRGIFTIAIDGHSYSYGCDYLPYDTNDPPDFDVIKFTRVLPTGVSVAFDNTLIISSQGKIVDTEGTLDTRAVTLLQNDSGTYVPFTTGSILATGLLNYH
jgi:prepilin-type N-terminal cleavage/methylation domain-containing protein